MNFDYKTSFFKNFFRLIFILALADVVFIFFYFLNPNYLDKPARIQIVDNYPKFNFTTKPGNKNILFSFLKKKKNLYGRTFAESRSSRINKFLKGYGNCANQASGLGILLNQIGCNYAIIHMINANEYFRGIGHSIIYTKLDDTFIFFDPLGGSTIKNNGKFANFQDLLSAITTGKIKLGTSVININNPVATNNLFQNPNLDSIFVGVTIEKEIDKYYSYLNLIGLEHHVQSNISQKIIRGSALMFNVLPKIYVSKGILKKNNFNFYKFYFFKLLTLVFVSLNWIIITSFLFLFFSLIKQLLATQ